MAETKLKPQSTLAPPQGFLYNGKIVPSVASNNLTVALKGLDGNDPSATNPVYVRIGDSVRSITAALSVTKNAGTNWCNAGSAELATKEIDYFVYLGYNATDGVVIGFSRFPGAFQYDDFSTTSTNEKYCAISTITTAASTDYYQLIGRFAATLSAGAGYTWTVPTFTAKNLIQRPIYETRWLTWLPTWVGYSSPPNGGNLVYKIIIDTMYVNFASDNNGTSNTAAAGQATLPMSSAGGWEVQPGAVIDNGASVATPGSFQINSGVSLDYVLMYKDGAGSGWTASGARNLRGRISYKI